MTHRESENVDIRWWLPGDAEELAPLANDRRIWANLRDAFPHPYGLDDARRFIAKAQGMDPQSYFAVVVSGRIAGGIGYTPGTDVERVGAEVGYWLGPGFWGRGIGTAALRAVTDHAFRADRDLCRLFAVPFAGNMASARILEHVGYRLEGTLRQSAIKEGRVVDQWMYAMVRSEWAAAAIAGSPVDRGS